MMPVHDEVRKSKTSASLFFPLAAACLLVVLAAGAFAARALLLPVHDSGGEAVTVVVPKNASTAQIARLLEDQGIIKNDLAFRVYARWRQVDEKLKPGTYELHTAMSVPDILRKLVEGPPDRIRITVPEGYTVAQIAELLERKGVAGREEFLQSTRQHWDFPFLRDVPADTCGLEGYLYPDTYYVGSGTKPDKIVAMMLQKFGQVIEEHDYVRRAAERGLSLHQAVTIASMVEREARVEGERPRIAGVIFNRLRLGMPLQIDATVQYALGQPKEQLLYRDLEIDSPYNTYKITGLPPGPIANPGWSSLRAVVEPEQNDYLYYVAKPGGTHAFARTLSEHNANKRKYQ